MSTINKSTNLIQQNEIKNLIQQNEMQTELMSKQSARKVTIFVMD